MKAEFTETGVLWLIAENGTESFALKSWQEKNKTAAVQIKNEFHTNKLPELANALAFELEETKRLNKSLEEKLIQ